MSKSLIVTFAADTVGELHEKVLAYAKEVGLDTSSTQMPLPLSNGTTEPSAEKKTRGRPAKTAEPVATASPLAASPAPVVEATQAQPAQPTAAASAVPAPAKTEVAAMLTDLMAKTDFNSSLAVLRGFNAGKFSELKESDYAAFIAAAKKAINDKMASTNSLIS